VRHAEGLEHALAQVAVEGQPADVLDDLAQGGEPVIGVGPLGSWFDVDVQSPSVVRGERRWWASRPRGPAERRPEQVGGVPQRADSGGVGQ
jgi:hypothetical protein